VESSCTTSVNPSKKGRQTVPSDNLDDELPDEMFSEEEIAAAEKLFLLFDNNVFC
jgi:hypothetical protein